MTEQHIVDIRGIGRAKVLAALYNASKPLGLSILAYDGGHIMSEEEAAEMLKEQTYFDYVYGRVMKISLKTYDLDVRLYDRDNGTGAAWRAIARVL